MLTALIVVGAGMLLVARTTTGVAAAGAEHSLGLSTAPVVVEVWSDFECPACQRFTLGLEQQLKQTLVVDGTARLVYRHFAFLGEESVWASAASECADEQGRFWDFHDLLFTHTAGRDRSVFTKPRLKEYAGTLGLDGEAFATCVDSGRYEDWVRAQTSLGGSKALRARQRWLSTTYSQR